MLLSLVKSGALAPLHRHKKRLKSFTCYKNLIVFEPPTDFLLEMTTLLNGDRIWLFGKHLANFGVIAISCDLILYFRRIVNERKLGVLTFDHLRAKI